MILSLQGCMAAGKATAVRYLQVHASYLHVSWEEHQGVIQEARRRQLDKNVYEDYLEIQRLWLKNEVERHEEALAYPNTVMDFGAEEIEFYTLNYPKSIGARWDVEEPLAAELAEVRACLPDRVLFLDASDEVLRAHKAGDATRSRNFFEQHLQTLPPSSAPGLPSTRTWTGYASTTSRPTRSAPPSCPGATPASSRLPSREET